MRVPPSLLLVFLLAAGGQAETSAQVQAPGTGQGAANPVTPGGGPLVLEFDLPDEFGTAPAGSATAVSGFRVGYFRGTEPTAIRTVDFKRDAVTVNGRTARVTVPRVSPSECGDDCVVRVQTVSANATSSWSVPVSLTGRAPAAQPAPARSATPRAPRRDRPRQTPPRDRRQGLSLADVERIAPLSELLRTLLPADAKIETEVARFRRVQDLALAAVVSRDHSIPFTTLSRALAGPPPVQPRDALMKLRPNMDIRAVIGKARDEARKLVGTPGRRGIAPSSPKPEARSRVSDIDQPGSPGTPLSYVR